MHLDPLQPSNVGLARTVYIHRIPYMTVYLVISLPKYKNIQYIDRV
jgi:hypothetical protein